MYTLHSALLVLSVTELVTSVSQVGEPNALKDVPSQTLLLTLLLCTPLEHVLSGCVMDDVEPLSSHVRFLSPTPNVVGTVGLVLLKLPMTMEI